jgi:hypothetical protein
LGIIENNRDLPEELLEIDTAWIERMMAMMYRVFDSVVFGCDYCSSTTLPAIPSRPRSPTMIPSAFSIISKCLLPTFRHITPQASLNDALRDRDIPSRCSEGVAVS